MELLSVKIDNSKYQELLDTAEELGLMEKAFNQELPNAIFKGMHCNEGPITQEELSKIYIFFASPCRTNWCRIRHISVVASQTLNDVWKTSKSTSLEFDDEYPQPELLFKLIQCEIKVVYQSVQEQLSHVRSKIDKVQQAEKINH